MRFAPALVAAVLLLFGAEARAADRAYQSVIDQAVAGGVPGVQAYVRRGRAEWFGVAGLASVEDQRAMTLDDRLRIASITKMMTYALTMKFVKAKKLKLSDRAVNLLGENALQGIPNAANITVRTLLDHTSGLHNFNGASGRDFFADLINDPKRGKRVHSAEELVAYARKPEHGPTGAPGAKTSYSSTGYIVLEMILTHVGKAPLAKLFRDELFAPLAMTLAGVEGADLTTAQIADAYGIPDPTDTRPSPFAGRKKVRPDGLIDLSRGLTYYNAWARGAGAVAASVKDLAKFMEAVDAGRLTVLNRQAAEYASVRGRRSGKLNWNGGSWGIQASIFSAPARDTTVIVLSNATNVGPSSSDIGGQLLAAAAQ